MFIMNHDNYYYHRFLEKFHFEVKYFAMWFTQNTK